MQTVNIDRFEKIEVRPYTLKKDTTQIFMCIYIYTRVYPWKQSEQYGECHKPKSRQWRKAVPRRSELMLRQPTGSVVRAVPPQLSPPCGERVVRQPTGSVVRHVPPAVPHAVHLGGKHIICQPTKSVVSAVPPAVPPLANLALPARRVGGASCSTDVPPRGEPMFSHGLPADGVSDACSPPSCPLACTACGLPAHMLGGTTCLTSCPGAYDSPGLKVPGASSPPSCPPATRAYALPAHKLDGASCPPQLSPCVAIEFTRGSKVRVYPWKQSLVTTGSQSIGILVGILQSVNPGNEQSSKQSSATHATGAAQRARREGAARRAGHGAGGAAPRETKGGKLRTKKADRNHQWPTEEGLMRPRTPHRRPQTPVKKVRQ